MSFEPRYEKHAIDQIAVAIGFARSFQENEMNNFEKNHDLWREELPRFEPERVISFSFGPEPVEPRVPPSARVFQAYRRDGRISWRLGARENTILVNCLEYTRWDEVWRKAKSFVQRALPYFSEDNQIISFQLQYIDLFRWHGVPDEIDFQELLRSPSKYVPDMAWDKGAIWHLHLGWFIPIQNPVSGRLLERTHLDAVFAEGDATTKIDSVLRLDLTESVHKPDQVLDGPEPVVDRVYDYLHLRHKEIFGEFLSEQMCKRIGLWS